MRRKPEPELMPDPAEALAYARADFADVNQAFVARLVELVECSPDTDGPTAGPMKKQLRGLRAIDLGTGPADIPIRLLHARPGWHVTGVDASAAMLSIARDAVRRARLLRSIRLVCADATATGLPPHSFDVVFSNSLLHHVAAPERLWAEVIRLARLRAVVFFRDLVRPESPIAARRIVRTYAGHESRLLQDEYLRSLLSAYTPAEVRTQLTRAGLRTLRVVMATDRHFDVFGRVT